MKRPPRREKRRPRTRQTVEGEVARVIDIVELREQGDWKAVADAALRCGDPQLWPDIEDAYRDHPEYRFLVLLRLPIYWREQEATVAPLLREALSDPMRCSDALHAASVFPSLID